MSEVSRREDMSPSGTLTLMIQYDRDVVVVVTNEDGLRVHVEFCEIFNGGGGSPNTFNALHELFKAMEKDNQENPNSRAVSYK